MGDAKDDAVTSGVGSVAGSYKWREEQQQVINICYSVLVFLFGFVWPLTALCWLYLRMYEAALKNAARTRRQSLSSNATDNVQIAPDTLPLTLPLTLPPQACNFAHQSPASSASNIRCFSLPISFKFASHVGHLPIKQNPKLFGFSNRRFRYMNFQS